MRNKTKTNTEPPQKSEVHTKMNRQQQNHLRRTDSTLAKGGGGAYIHFIVAKSSP